MFLIYLAQTDKSLFVNRIYPGSEFVMGGSGGSYNLQNYVFEAGFDVVGTKLTYGRAGYAVIPSDSSNPWYVKTGIRRIYGVL